MKLLLYRMSRIGTIIFNFYCLTVGEICPFIWKIYCEMTGCTLR